jgi:hypothetical protein
MKKTFAFLVLVFAVLLSACAASPVAVNVTPTPTPNPGEIALNMIQQQMAAEATSQVVGLQFTATAQVLGMTATSQAVSTAEAITQQARIDAQATSDQARRDAVATQQRLDAVATAEQERQDSIFATGQAVLAMQSTQSADATATFTSMTLTAIPPHATLTQIYVDNQIVLATQDVERAALELKQARDTNVLTWLVPFLIAITATGAGLLWVIRESRWHIVKNDEGDIEGFGHDEKFIVPKLLPGPVLNLRTSTMPQLTGQTNQAEIVRNEQKIRALAAIPVSPTESGKAAFNQFFSGEKKEDPFEIIDGDVLPPTDLLDAETLKITEKEWQDANAK